MAHPDAPNFAATVRTTDTYAHIDSDRPVQQTTIDALLLLAHACTIPSVDQGDPQMTDELAATIERAADRACKALAEHMRDTIKYAPDYARRYATGCLTGRRGAPHTAELPGEIQRLIRDLVQDALMADRRRDVA